MGGAVFSDIEGTLVDGSIPRMSLNLGRQMGLFSPCQVAQAASYAALAKVTTGNLKRRAQLQAVIGAMAGQTEDDTQRLVDALIPLVLTRVKPDMLARLGAHQSAGLPLIFVSGGIHEAVARIGEALGGRGEGTRLVVRGGRYSAQLDGPACQGQGKAERARSIFTEQGYNPAECYAYGDTASDIPFLALFGHPHAVDPDAALAAEARRRNWPILATVR